MYHVEVVEAQVVYCRSHGRRDARRIAELEFEAEAPVAGLDEEIEFGPGMQLPVVAGVPVDAEATDHLVQGVAFP